MAEADWHRCREQFGYFVYGSEFLSGGEEGVRLSGWLGAIPSQPFFLP